MRGVVRVGLSSFAGCLLASGLYAAAPAAADPSAQVGRSGYELHCSGCHQPNGAGAPGSFPPLVGAPFVVGDPRPVIEVVVRGRGIAMPPVSLELSDADVAAIISYMRSSWGNGAAPVTADDVASVRADAK